MNDSTVSSVSRGRIKSLSKLRSSAKTHLGTVRKYNDTTSLVNIKLVPF